MVLVSYKLNNKISILQTKLSNRERHEARHVGEEAMPLDQHIEGGHGEREAGVEIRPASVRDFLKVAHDGQHRQDRLHDDAILPLPPATAFELATTPLAGMDGGNTQDVPAPVKPLHEPTKAALCRVGSR